MPTNVGKLNAKFNLDATNFVSTLDKSVLKTKNATSTMGSKFSSLSNTIKSVIGVAAIGTLVAFGKKLADTTAGFESIDRTLRFATGSVKSGAEAFNFAKAESERLGLSLGVASKEYGRLAASAKGTTLEGEQTRDIFKAIASASAVMGMSAQQTELAFVALAQMISKGTISSEELRQQLGDHLPGAMQIMARSIGVTTQDLSDLLKKGSLLAEDVLPRFAKQIVLELGGSVQEASKGMQASLGRLGTAWFEFRKALLEEGGVGAAVKVMIDLVAVGINRVTEGIRYLVQLWQSYVSPIITKAQDLYRKIFGGPAVTETIQTQKDLTVEAKKHADALSAAAVEAKKYGQELLATSKKAKKVKRTPFEKMFSPTEMEQDYQLYKDFFSGVTQQANNLASSLADLTVGGTLDMKKFALAIIRSLNEIILQFYVATPIIEAFRNLLAGLHAGGGISSGVGGIVGGIFGAVKSFFGFASGGILTEPVVGIGANTGSGYAFGERGAEAVVPLSAMDNGEAAQQPTNISINISAVDSQSLVALMRKNPQAIVTPVIEALQIGDRGLMSSLRGSVI